MSMQSDIGSSSSSQVSFGIGGCIRFNKVSGRGCLPEFDVKTGPTRRIIVQAPKARIDDQQGSQASRHTVTLHSEVFLRSDRQMSNEGDLTA
jgi:hypothetical protein